MDQTRTQCFWVVSFETSNQEFDKIEILKKKIELLLIVTLVPFVRVDHNPTQNKTKKNKKITKLTMFFNVKPSILNTIQAASTG
jgi:hypothetical protein